MPFFQAMASRANATLTKQGLRGKDPDLFGEGRSLVADLRELRIVETDEEAAYVDAFPSGLREAVRALLRSNLTSGEPLDVTFSWAPGYDDEVTLWQVANSDRSGGGITIFVRSRYPDDRGGTAGAIRR